MAEWENWDYLFYGGIAVMIAAAALAVLCFAVHIMRKRRLNRRLDAEYGEPQRYNIREKL